MEATWSPGEGGLKQGVLRKELTWHVGGMAGRPSVSEDSGQQEGREVVSKQWAGEPEVGWKPWMVQSRGVM